MKPFLVALLLPALAVACAAPSPPPPAAPAPVAPPSAAPPRPAVDVPAQAPTTTGSDLATTPKQRLGHYSSADGLWGMVLDRTATPPLAKVDGTSALVDLAVRRGGSGVTLSDATGAIVLSIDDWGHVVRVGVDGKAIPLRRDADAQPLGAAQAASPIDESALRASEARAKEICGSKIRFELKGTASPRGAHHTMERALRMLGNVCRDKAGKDAVSKKLTTIQVGQAPASKITFAGSTLTVLGDLEGEGLGPYPDEMAAVLEPKL